MAETPLMFGDVLFQLVRMFAFLAFVIGVTVAFILIFRTSELDYADKVAREVGETILASEASDGYGILVIEELGKYKMGDEPFARHCSYGYTAEIESSNGQRWEFGMEQQPTLEKYLKASREFPVGLKHEGGSYVEYTGKMKITVHETLLTQLSCLLESVRESGRRQALSHTLTSQDALFAELEVRDGIGGSNVYYDIRLAQKNGELCAVDDKGEPMGVCRKISAPFDGFRMKYKYGIKEVGRDTTFAAIPVKETTSAVRCGDISPDIVATTRDEMKTIALCIDDKELELE
ncbi:MAG: hypothetical protein HY365_01220 [Candidatus Aenigmarchaeota archaeon]|nr:hypothetical protein [Candidatus Aenigmarchaeota archaeon]